MKTIEKRWYGRERGREERNGVVMWKLWNEAMKACSENKSGENEEKIGLFSEIWKSRKALSLARRRRKPVKERRKKMKRIIYRKSNMHVVWLMKYTKWRSKASVCGNNGRKPQQSKCENGWNLASSWNIPLEEKIKMKAISVLKRHENIEMKMISALAKRKKL